MSAAEDLDRLQQQIVDGEIEQTSFGSPEHGRLVELMMCDYFGLEHTDLSDSDARDSDGRKWQIKGCRVEHSNGGDTTTPGRWDVWSDPLVSLLHDDGGYLLVVYNGDIEPGEVTRERFDDYILAWKFVDAADFGALIDPGAWHDGNRDKGSKARLSWPHVFDGVQK